MDERWRRALGGALSSLQAKTALITDSCACQVWAR
jgi:hypothetical protein